MTTENILVVDDEKSQREILEMILTGEGYNVTIAPSGESALKLARERDFDLVVTDYKMTGMDGIELLSELLIHDSSIPVIILTTHGSVELAKAALRLGAFDFVEKPFMREDLIEIVKRALSNKAVFIVHGHDEGAKESVARYLEKLKLKPIILHEQPNAGRTIIEKFERYSKVSFVIVLLTPDDIFNVRNVKPRKLLRARQNVIFELGYFIGLLGRSNVCALYKEGVEIPSDYQGVLFIPMDAGGAWRLLLAREIRAAGFTLDINKAF